MRKERVFFNFLFVNKGRNFEIISYELSATQNQIHTITKIHRMVQVSIGHIIIDTGIEVNILLESEVPSLIKKIFRTPITLRPSGSKIITPKGQISFETTCGNAEKTTWIIVVNMDLKGNPSNLLFCKFTESLRIISFHNPQNSINAFSTQNLELQTLQEEVTPDESSIISSYFLVFDGLRKLKADPVVVHLRPDAKPIIQTHGICYFFIYSKNLIYLLIQWNNMAS